MTNSYLGRKRLAIVLMVRKVSYLKGKEKYHQIPNYFYEKKCLGTFRLKSNLFKYLNSLLLKFKFATKERYLFVCIKINNWFPRECLLPGYISYTPPHPPPPNFTYTFSMWKSSISCFCFLGIPQMAFTFISGKLSWTSEEKDVNIVPELKLVLFETVNLQANFPTF